MFMKEKKNSINLRNGNNDKIYSYGFGGWPVVIAGIAASEAGVIAGGGTNGLASGEADGFAVLTREGEEGEAVGSLDLFSFSNTFSRSRSFSSLNKGSFQYSAISLYKRFVKFGFNISFLNCSFCSSVRMCRQSG